MKQFSSQQKGDYRASKIIFKKVWIDDLSYCLFFNLFFWLVRKSMRAHPLQVLHRRRNYMKDARMNYVHSKNLMKTNIFRSSKPLLIMILLISDKRCFTIDKELRNNCCKRLRDICDACVRVIIQDFYHYRS